MILCLDFAPGFIIGRDWNSHGISYLNQDHKLLTSSTASGNNANTTTCSVGCFKLFLITETKELLQARTISVVPGKSTSLVQTQNSHFANGVASPLPCTEMPCLHIVPIVCQLSQRQPRDDKYVSSI